MSPTVTKAITNDTRAAHEAGKRGYLLCKFNREQLAIDFAYRRRVELAGLELPNHRDVGIYPLYPDYGWGAIAVWAWGHGVVLDALDRLGYSDMERTVVTGHSRGGRAAIVAGIFDERIGVISPCTGGYGSCGTLRILDPQGVNTKDQIEWMKVQYLYWHVAKYHSFSGQQNRLPFDAHTRMSLIATRPLLNTNATEDEFNNTLSIEAGIRAG